MRYLIFLFILFILSSCCQKESSSGAINERFSELELKLGETYKPGLGSIMLGIQIHHDKLWFAGINENWELAEFAMEELDEGFEDIKNYHPERKETQDMEIIFPAVDSMERAIELKDLTIFKEQYDYLTRSCNKCHVVTDHPFVQIKTPDRPIFSNQDFKPLQQAVSE
jgi:uncharacterized lipoprotein YehR (DUF1307 family)